MYFAIATEECTRYIVADYTREVDVRWLIHSSIYLFITKVVQQHTKRK